MNPVNSKRSGCGPKVRRRVPVKLILVDVHRKHHATVTAATKSTAPSSIIARRVRFEFTLSGVRFGGRQIYVEFFHQQTMWDIV
jgi:hypothetical protein